MQDVQYRVIHAFSAKLGEAVSWHHIELTNKSGFALFFDDKLWKIDPESNALTYVGETPNGLGVNADEHK